MKSEKDVSEWFAEWTNEKPSEFRSGVLFALANVLDIRSAKRIAKEAANDPDRNHHPAANCSRP